MDERNYLAGVSIAAEAGYRYAVTFRGGYHDDDSVRLVLHYYAGVLYELGRERSVRNLPEIIERVTMVKLSWNHDVFAACGIRGALVTSVPHPIGSADVVLVANHRELTLDGDIRFTSRTLAYSVCALIAAVVRRISPDATSTLLLALANMNASYGVTHRYADPHSRREVPAIAYLAAAFV